MSAGWVVTLVTAAFLLGYGARALVAWWRQEEEREDEGFYRHFGAALTHLGAGRKKEAIEELTQAARHRSDIAGLYLILGDLYRELGQFDRAIRIHASLLPRGDLSRTERAQAYTGLGEDYRTAGILDRSKEAFRQALDLDARSLPALKGLSRFAVESEMWSEAADLEDRILRLEPTRSGQTLGYIYYEMGLEELKADDEKAALRSFQKAISWTRIRGSCTSSTTGSSRSTPTMATRDASSRSATTSRRRIPRTGAFAFSWLARRTTGATPTPPTAT